MQNLLYDKEFLKKLDKNKNKTIYARITSLQFDETPIETIEGRVTSGSINIDGASAVRRTCSLSMVAQDFQYNDFYWGLNTKFKLEIGVQNTVDLTYPEIIWFKQGTYLITNFNPSRSTNNFTISISGKDKMCLLNGEVGGSLESQVDFGTMEEEDSNGLWVKRSIPIKDIIKNAVHVYGGEPIHNIIINDLPEYGLELLEYRYDLPMYLYRKTNSPNYVNALINGDKLCRIKGQTELKALKNLTNSELETLVDSLVGTTQPSEIYFDNDETPYYVAKIEYGQTAGYRETELTYPGDLIANVGESVVSILDKIKNMFGEFEYFYDIDGRFIFQKKKTYINSPWSPIVKDDKGEEAVLKDLSESAATAYTFNEGELITTFNNNMNLLNVRNDYSVWGERIGVSGSALPVHLRYAIDKKPTYYKSIDDKEIVYDTDNYDWRELIYQMACDYYKYNKLDDFSFRIAAKNPQFIGGRTGYEQYYIDMQGFWRQLYNPEILKDIEETSIKIEEILGENYDITKPNEINGINGIKGFIFHTENLLPELKNNYSINPSQEKYDIYREAEIALAIKKSELALLEEKYDNLEKKLKQLNDIKDNFYDIDSNNKYWCKDVFERPEMLNFWFDFLDTEGELSKFNVKVIGARAKALNDSNIKSIYFRETPSVLFSDKLLEDNDNQSGYRVIQIPKDYLDTMFSVSSQGKSAKSKLDELINQHGYCIDSATINAIPIYYLEPNSRIYLHDEDTSLDGDYIVTKITLPLTYNGTMSITANKAVQNIF